MKDDDDPDERQEEEEDGSVRIRGGNLERVDIYRDTRANVVRVVRVQSAGYRSSSVQLADHRDFAAHKQRVELLGRFDRIEIDMQIRPEIVWR